MNLGSTIPFLAAIVLLSVLSVASADEGGPNNNADCSWKNYGISVHVGDDNRTCVQDNSNQNNDYSTAAYCDQTTGVGSGSGAGGAAGGQASAEAAASTDCSADGSGLAADLEPDMHVVVPLPLGFEGIDLGDTIATFGVTYGEWPFDCSDPHNINVTVQGRCKASVNPSSSMILP